jgi:hypothetical protein
MRWSSFAGWFRPAPRRRSHRRRLPARIWRPRLETLESRNLLTNFVVVLATDNGGAAGQKVTATSGDLRYCIEQADATHTATSDTITFSSTVSKNPQTITLNSTTGPLAATPIR